MNSESTLQMTCRDRVATISLRAQQPTGALAVALERLIAQLDDERAASVIIFRGLESPSSSHAAALLDIDGSRRWSKTLERIERLGTMTVAAIDGTCTSAGLELALACVHRVATDRSRFIVTELRAGGLPGLKTLTLAKLVGIGVARRMVLLGEPLSAQDACAHGLVDKVCAAENLATAVGEIASALFRLDADAARLAKELLNESLSARPEDLVGLWLAAQRRCLARQTTTSANGEQGLLAALPRLAGNDVHSDLAIALPWLRRAEATILESDPARSVAKDSPAATLRQAARALRTSFFAHHAPEIYAKVRGGDPVRLDALVYAAAEMFPGLLPTRKQIESLTGIAQKEKHDAEIDQALFVAELLRHKDIGSAVIDTMRTAKPHSLSHLETFARTDRLDLDVARVERRGNVAYVSIANRACLNAENDALLEALETAADVALLDSRIDVCVLRGDAVEHEKYRGRRVFCSGINLTDLYNGRISYLYFVLRELGFVNKLYRGLRTDEGEIRKPWLMAVDTHAIGGGCQLLLVADYVIAERGARFSIPAHHEGFIPGAANLRLARFVGPRLARELIYMNRALIADGVSDVHLVDEVVASDAMDGAIERASAALARSAPAGFAGNHRMIRIGEESDEVFREYMASFARDQAQALFSPELIRNLEQHWMGRKATRTTLMQ